MLQINKTVMCINRQRLLHIEVPVSRQQIHLTGTVRMTVRKEAPKKDS